MKKAIVAIAVVGIVMITGAGVTVEAKDVQKEINKYVNELNEQKTKLQKTHFVAVRRGVDRDENLAQDIAIEGTKQDIKGQIETYVEGVFDRNVKTTATGSDTTNINQAKRNVTTIAMGIINNFETTGDKTFTYDKNNVYVVMGMLEKKVWYEKLNNKIKADAKLSALFDAQKMDEELDELKSEVGNRYKEQQDK